MGVGLHQRYRRAIFPKRWRRCLGDKIVFNMATVAGIVWMMESLGEE